MLWSEGFSKQDTIIKRLYNKKTDDNEIKNVNIPTAKKIKIKVKLYQMEEGLTFLIYKQSLYINKNCCIL